MAPRRGGGGRRRLLPSDGMLETSTSDAGRGRLLCLGALLCLLSLAAVRDGLLLTRFDIPAGIDGFYYAVQARSLVEGGTFYYPTNTPFVLYLVGGAAMVRGDPFTAVKVTGMFLHFVLTLSLFALATSMTKSMWAGLLAAAVSVVSVTHLIWVGEFLKQLGGLAFFFAGAACLTRKPGGRLWRPAALLLFGVSLLCHKSMIFLIVTLLCLALLFHLLLKLRSLTRRTARRSTSVCSTTYTGSAASGPSTGAGFITSATTT